MSKKYRVAFFVFLAVWFVGVLVFYLWDNNFGVLDPKGMVALKERNLMITTVLLGLLVVVPVYIMTFAFAWRYREGNKKAKYSPELSGNAFAEALWWGIPTAIITVLSVITWNSSHALEPRKPLDVPGKPLTVQVVALDWKWLFIYPEQDVASVNWVQLPVDKPVNFKITADAPMNAFAIPQLGSQIYAMPGMQTQVNLIANEAGEYAGHSANLSGEGFASMRFTAKAGNEAGFNNWIATAKRSPNVLSLAEYEKLARPSKNSSVTLYSSVDKHLFEKVVNKYRIPQAH